MQTEHTQLNGGDYLSYPRQADPPRAEFPATLQLQVMTITPALAQDWLGHNTHNRPPNLRMIQRYATSMRKGLWQLTGETIKFAHTGSLLDGQNRLQAIVEAQVPIRSAVCFGLAPEVFTCLDAGAKRSLCQILALAGEKSSSTLGGALGVLWMYQNGRFSQLGNNSLPPEEAMVLLAQHPRLRLSIEPGLAIKRLLLPRLSVAFHYLCACKNKEQTDFFWSRLATGENLDLTNPIHLLRERLIAFASNTKASPKTLEIAALLIKGWNAFTTGSRPKILKWMSHGKAEERFPVLEGDEDLYRCAQIKEDLRKKVSDYEQP